MLCFVYTSVVLHSSYTFNSAFMQDVDYEATMAAKLSLARKIFAREKDSILNSSSFQKYLSENEVWSFLLSWKLNLVVVKLKLNIVLILLPLITSVLILANIRWISVFHWKSIKIYSIFCQQFIIIFSFLCELLKGMVKTLCGVLFSAGLLWNIRPQPMGSFFSIFKRQGDDLCHFLLFAIIVRIS